MVLVPAVLLVVVVGHDVGAFFFFVCVCACVCVCVCAVSWVMVMGVRTRTSRALAACAARLLTKSTPIAKLVLRTRFSNLEAWSIQCLGAAMPLASKFAMHPQTAVRCSSQQSATSAATQSLQPGLCKWDGTLQLHVRATATASSQVCRAIAPSVICGPVQQQQHSASICQAAAELQPTPHIATPCKEYVCQNWSRLLHSPLALLHVWVCVCVHVLGGSQPVCKHSSDGQVRKVTAWLFRSELVADLRIWEAGALRTDMQSNSFDCPRVAAGSAVFSQHVADI